MNRAGRRADASRLGASRVAGLFTLLGILVLIAAVGISFVSRQLAPLSPSDRKPIPVEVPEGATVSAVASMLAERGVVRSPFSIRLAARFDPAAATHLRPGMYLIAPSESPGEILKKIAGGRMFVQRVLIPEGFTLRQIVDRLRADHLGDPDETLRIAETQGRTFHFPDGFTPPNDSLEGYLFPETYIFKPDITSQQIVQLMVWQFDQKVVRTHPAVKDWSRPIIAASLVEREAKLDIDRPLIAGVLENRLRRDMPLQVDATVEYALPEHKQRLLYSDLRTPSPYNTYLHRGLPPGPICSPGLPSIEAALHPARVDFLYYVAAPDGSHRFSRTLAEQDRNITAVRNASARG